MTWFGMTWSQILGTIAFAFIPFYMVYRMNQMDKKRDKELEKQ